MDVKAILETQIAAIQDRLETNSLPTDDYINLHRMLESYIHTYLNYCKIPA